MLPGEPRILVVRLSAIGDVLHALPAVTAIRRARPEAFLGWAVEDRAASILEGHPAIDRLHVFPRARLRAAGKAPWRWPGAALSVARTVASLVAARYDAVLDLQGNLKSSFFTALSAAPVRLGLPRGEAREGSVHVTNRRPRLRPGSLHRVERAVALASALVGERLAPGPADLPRSPDDGASADRILSAAGLPRHGFALLQPGTSGFGAFKRWPADRFARLAERIVEAGVPVGVAGGPGAEDARLVAAVRDAARVPLAAVTTPDLATLAEVQRRALVFVSADTGPLHVAAAVGTPVVGLFGPKDAAVYGPFGSEGAGAPRLLPVVERDDVPCRPCTLRWCPDPVCMTGIEVDSVFARVLPALSAAR